MAYIDAKVRAIKGIQLGYGFYRTPAGAARAYADSYMLYKHKKYVYHGTAYKAAIKRMTRRLTKVFKEWVK